MSERPDGEHDREEPDGAWLDPETSPLAVYQDRDLPYAPLAVQRERGLAPRPGRATDAPAPPAGTRPRSPADATVETPGKELDRAEATVRHPAPSAPPVPRPAPPPQAPPARPPQAVQEPPGPPPAHREGWPTHRFTVVFAVLVVVLVVVAAVVVVTAGGPPRPERPGFGPHPDRSSGERFHPPGPGHGGLPRLPS